MKRGRKDRKGGNVLLDKVKFRFVEALSVKGWKEVGLGIPFPVALRSAMDSGVQGGGTRVHGV